MMTSYCSSDNEEEDDREDFPGRLLHQAALWDNAELLEDLLNSDQLQHINSRDSWGRTPLHAAAPTDTSRCLKLLLQAGALCDLPAGPRADLKTVLHMAAESGAVENIRVLLQYRASLVARDSNGCTALDLAEKAEHTHCCSILKQAADARELARQELHGALREACTRGDVPRARTLLRDLGEEATVIINAAPNGTNTLLFKGCEEGHKEMVRLLLEHGADDRIHPVTKYSPLYVACYYGRKDIAEILLKKFPCLASVCTVEKWLPLHACIINGHNSVLALLLTFPYPLHCMLSFRDKSGRWQYQFAFDVNMRDVTGQSALYLASYCANTKMVDMMLKYKLSTQKIKTREEIEQEIAEQEREEEQARQQRDSCEPPLPRSSGATGCLVSPSDTTSNSNAPADNNSANNNNSSSSPTKSLRISGGIQALMSKLNLVKTDNSSSAGSAADTNKENMICPFDIDLYCNSNTETALHVAVKNRHHNIVTLLLAAAANPNLRIYLPDDKMAEQASQHYIFTGSTALVEACRNHDLGMVEMLLKNHARDDQCKALYIAAHNNDTIILSKLLALKAHPDPEYKIHKRCLEISPGQQFGSGLSVSYTGGAVYSGICPTVPVMINWHGQRCLPFVKDQWLVDASVQLNPKLRLSPRNQVMALYAITRLDVSNNALTQLPSVIFSLPSLRILNAGQNKLEQLPPGLSCVVSGAVDGTATLPRRGNKNKSALLAGRLSSSAVVPGCTVSVLEEIHLQDNRLDYLPEGLFSLPALQHLDVSNNKLTCLPYKMWSAPKLRDLNLSLNLLSTLPSRPDQSSSSSADSQPLEPFLDDEDPAGGTGLSDGSSTSSTPKSTPKSGLPRPMSHTGGGSTVSSIGGDSTSHGSGGTTAGSSVSMGSLSSHQSGAEEEEGAAKKSRDSRGGLSLDKHGNVITCCRQRELRHHSLWTQAVQVQESLSSPASREDRAGGGAVVVTSCLQSLNLSHNAFTAAPPGLPCLALQLSRLNLSYNRLSAMGPAWSYPSGLKQLDLSHNSISAWPNMGHYTAPDNTLLEAESLPCCASNASKTKPSSAQGRRSRAGSHSSSGGGVVCLHRRHARLEGLRTLVLANNQLTRLCLYLDEGDTSLQLMDPAQDQQGVKSTAAPKGRLVFPSLSMLDVSNNCLRELPTTLHHLNNLAVLNISGNPEIQELPPEMGLLSRMWNLNTRGCGLHEPLNSMIESKKYKTMDVIGYLKSILEDARPYARMKLMIVGVAGIGKTSLLEQLRQEGTGSYRKKPAEHWATRMGNRNISTRTSRGGIMSTVGVDIGDWTYEKKVRGHSSHGPVIFRTWDFGGQKEYYATHQYFLSKRSLYLVVWKITDGEKAIDDILQWLVNIQARAPNSPVLILGTHYDLVRQKFPPSWSEDLQQIIRDRFINVIDADKLGLPRVLDTIEISCKSRHNIKLLCNLIYDTVFSLKTPGSKERLLEQRIPASYLALEDVVAHLALERRLSGRDPVLSHERYQALVTQELANRGLKPFRDTAELNQATTFLHENGVLLHYDDATLKELYFLDPQWLCDMLAHVVTIREINPFAKNGLMKLDDLKHVFKTSSCAPVDAKSYIVSLLNKFEVALTWDNRTLLIPSLLPSEEQLRAAPKGCDARVKIPLRARGWAARNKRFSGCCSSAGGGTALSVAASTVVGGDEDRRHRPSFSGSSSLHYIGSPRKDGADGSEGEEFLRPGVQISHRSSAVSAIRRLLLMSYFPSGFWSRLMTRVLADDAILGVVKNYFVLPTEVTCDGDLCSVLGGAASCPEWLCWQSGLELRYANTTLIRICENTAHAQTIRLQSSPAKQRSSGGHQTANINHDYKTMRFLVKQEGVWSDVEIKNSAVLEIVLPNEAVVIKRTVTPPEGDGGGADASNTTAAGGHSDQGGSGEGRRGSSGGLAEGIQSVVLDPSLECVTKLLALAVDHIDTLLEDWYPTLGTRFVHTSEGKFLITRLLPCPVCLDCHGHPHPPLLPPNYPTQLPDNWGSFVEMNPLYCSMTGSVLAAQMAGQPGVAATGLPSDVMTGAPPNIGGVAHGPAYIPQPPVPAVDGLLNAAGGAHGKPADGGAGAPLSPLVGRRSYGSRESYASDGDSGVGPDSNSSSRNPSAEGRPAAAEGPNIDAATQEVTPVVYSFLVEECILAAYTPPPRLTCPLHSVLLLAQIAPDTVFLDLGEQHLVAPESVQQGKLLGRGGFGFVFQGTCRHRVTGDPLDVALKMLQPVDPGHGARASAVQAYKACVSKWERDPLQYACKAYCCARQEINILLSLRHCNIVPFVGVCPRPLALVLELAPQGALDQCLKHYQRSGARLSLFALQAVILQVAKALEYLHGQHIIYRDLKSENVLVWDLPLPFSSQKQPRVDVRVADYGISRASLPSGTKGFGGTEGFMAPEMMRFNGEEEYTEKVDVFSYGMFLYELLTTHQPYEQCDNVKELVLEGGRPALTYRETQYPVYLLDLMVLCWSNNPRQRPSASQVVSIATAPEFTTLLDVASLEHSTNVMAATTVPPATRAEPEWSEGEDEESDGASWSCPPIGGIWISRTSPQLDMLLAGGGNTSSSNASTTAHYTAGVSSGVGRSPVTGSGWSSYSTIEGLPDTITAMCCVDDTVWLGDNAGNIHGYSHASNMRVFSYCLEPDSPHSSAVRAIAHLHSGLARVAVALSNGRLFVCCGDARPTTPVCGEGSFVMTELAADTYSLHCLAVTLQPGLWKLWCGGSNTRMSVFSFRCDGLVINQESISHTTTTTPQQPRTSGSHFEPEDHPPQDYSAPVVSSHPIQHRRLSARQESGAGGERGEEEGDVLLVYAPDKPHTVSPKLRRSLWTYVYPGCVVYHWDASEQRIVNRLDCSKLVPCSESLQSISIEERLSPANCQVSAIGVCGREIYVGTSWGCIIVAEASSMRPITVFRPYEDEVRSILTLWPPPPDQQHKLPGQDKPASGCNKGDAARKDASKPVAKQTSCDISPKNNSSNNSSSNNKKDPSLASSLANSSSNNNRQDGSTASDSQQATSPSQQQQNILSPSSQKSFSNISNKSGSSFSLSSSSVTSSNSSSNITGAGQEWGAVDESEDWDNEPIIGGVTPMVATIGKGYRNLLARYAPMPKSAQHEARAVYCLLWRANSWTN
uniref:non-specific serine/threonine protein kinase n=2 Tax=Hirondellea gigas TaxID=1518452 RepID=A0A6A7FVB2_9CRUS